MSNSRSIVLASSPVVGPVVMERLAQALRRRQATVATPFPHVDVDAYVDAASAASAEQGCDALVGFSAGGSRLFAVAQRLRPRSMVFMDATIPVPGTAPDAEPAMAALLDRLPIDADGLLAPWPEWWPPETLERLCLDHELRRQLIAECLPVPRAMYAVPVAEAEFDGPCGFLAFGEGYAEQRALAERRGWPTLTLPGTHLAPLTQPDAVADALLALIDRLVT